MLRIVPEPQGNADKPVRRRYEHPGDWPRTPATRYEVLLWLTESQELARWLEQGKPVKGG